MKNKKIVGPLIDPYENNDLEWVIANHQLRIRELEKKIKAFEDYLNIKMDWVNVKKQVKICEKAYVKKTWLNS